ncbi:MAG TPA: class I SAM-dependent methyltransferase [Actinomycetota bacterium]|nr:class I SAM-dependent methyltransferase [Actinomycetota bacterium]
MEGYDPLTVFGRARAASYDETLRGDEDATVDLLAELARGGPALELAIGTGRIALPLAARGVRVDGIESSQAMVDRLRAKAGGSDLDVTVGDMSRARLPGRYPLVFLVYNTLFNLLTQDDQVRCFENAAVHLDDGGAFVVEAIVPSQFHRLRGNQYVDAEAIELDEVWLDVGRHDPVAQRLDESHVRLSAEGVVVQPIVTRYAWPSEMDLMARIAGLRLRERWGGWAREPFTSASTSHVSVYGH